MQRFGIATCALICAAGCQPPKMTMDELFAKPERSTELAKLDRFIGTWSGTAEMVSPTTAEMNEMISDGTLPESFKGSGTYEWVLDGRFLKEEGWHEMPDGQRVNYLAYWTWDERKKKYRSWFFSDYGEFGDGSLRFTDADTLKMRFEGTDSKGGHKHGGGEMIFTSDNNMDWTWHEGNLFFQMKMKGSSTKK